MKRHILQSANGVAIFTLNLFSSIITMTPYSSMIGQLEGEFNQIARKTIFSHLLFHADGF